MVSGMNKGHIILLLGAVLLFSCRASKTLPDLNYEDPLKDHSLYKAKAKVEIIDGGNSQKATMNLRLHKDKMIWLSISNKVEGARVLILPDSVKFIDRIHKTYYANSLDSMGKLFNFTLDFEMIQNLLTSRTPNSETINWSTSGKKAMGNEQRAGWSVEYLLNTENGRLENVQIKQIQGADKLSVNYAETLDYEGGTVSKLIYLSAYLLRKGKGREVKANLNYDKFNFVEEEDLSFPFKIPSKYEKL